MKNTKEQDELAFKILNYCHVGQNVEAISEALLSIKLWFGKVTDD